MIHRRLRIVIIMVCIASIAPLGTWLLARSAGRPPGLGVHEGRLAPCPSTPNCVCTQSDTQLHSIVPIPLESVGANPDEAMARIRTVVRAYPRTRVVTESSDYLHAECRSAIFGFVDDVEFFVDRETGLIHFRSASRVGRSDLGVNRARMEAFRRLLRRS